MKILGKPGAIEQSKSYTGGPTKPNVTTQTWKGTKAAILALLEQVQEEGLEYQLDETGPTATLKTTNSVIPGDDPTSSVLTNNWELTPGEVEKDLLEADVAVINSLLPATKEKIRKLISQHDDSTVNDATFSPDPNAATATKIYNYMTKGMRAVRIYAPVLKHTMTVTSRYQTQVSMANVGKILKTTTLVGNEGVPAGFLIPLSGAPFTNTPADSNNYTYGWYKKPPTLQVAAGGQFQISQEWEFGLWATLFYGAAV